MGLFDCGVRDPGISNLVAVLRMRGCLRIELREGRGLVDHMAAILGRLPEGLFVIEAQSSGVRCPRSRGRLAMQGPRSKARRKAIEAAGREFKVHVSRLPEVRAAMARHRSPNKDVTFPLTRRDLPSTKRQLLTGRREYMAVILPLDKRSEYKSLPILAACLDP